MIHFISPFKQLYRHHQKVEIKSYFGVLKCGLKIICTVFSLRLCFFHLQNLNEEELLQRIILKIKWD